MSVKPQQLSTGGGRELTNEYTQVPPSKWHSAHHWTRPRYIHPGGPRKPKQANGQSKTPYHRRV